MLPVLKNNSDYERNNQVHIFGLKLQSVYLVIMYNKNMKCFFSLIFKPVLFFHIPRLDFILFKGSYFGIVFVKLLYLQVGMYSYLYNYALRQLSKYY